jgi:peptide/nickel transport system substrate-binding protein
MCVVRFLALLVCLAVSACSRVPAAPPRSSNQPVTLAIGWPFISGQDSINGIQQATRLLSFEGLVFIGRDGRPQPRLAQSMTESPDGLSWAFQLRPNAFFHDGSRVDSAAVKASLVRTLASPARDFSPGLLDIVGLDTPKPDQLVIRMKTRSAFLLDDLIVSIAKPVPGGGAVGTGPYVTSSTSPATSSTSPTEVVMKAFPSYYRGVPNIDRIVWKSYTTARTAWAAMMRGEIDFLYDVAPDAADFMRDEASVEDFSFLRNYVHSVVFNSRRPLFQDSRVKRALNYAVDRSAIIDQVFKGHGVAAYTPTWPQHWAYDTKLPSYAYDPARAVALLDATGLKFSDRVDPQRSPARLRFTCILPANIAASERMALIVQRNLSQIGVDMQLETVNLDELNRRVLAGNFDAVLIDLVAGNSAGRPYVLWYSTSKQNSAGYHDAQVDQAFDRLRQAIGDDATREAFHDLQLQFLNDPPALFLAFGETTRAVSRRFQPVTPAGGDVFRTIPEWQLADGLKSRNTN